ncbi:DUF6266 family protein [Saccharicrinis aurantiacus]|uniref:DUF6266 family protein n=1 Tax=Saccharicrinis aurantiacus TaxID=1849719 RepID=UPI002491A9D8|nr:DUF6266 family protein [Saccharicrinis aurantiacus]
MARYKTSREGASGKLGNVVTYQMYGKSYVRSLPGSYKDAKSEKQLAQRQKMQLVNGFLSPFKEILRLTFKEEALGRSAYMAAKSYNMRNAIVGEYPEQKIDYTLALVSKGIVPLPAEASITRTADGLLFKWSDEVTGNGSDTLLLIANQRGQYATISKMTGIERKEKSYLWKESTLNNSNTDIWIVFRDYKERGFSDSLWLGQIK